MAQNEYYPEEVLIEKMERGEYGWLDYVNHFSPDGRKNMPSTVKSRHWRSTTTLLQNSSDSRMNNSKPPWKAEKYNRELWQ